MPTTRLAPSPTGALHLGNARTFLVNWALARQHGWRIVLRIEDLDGPRIKAEAAEKSIDILSWLGLDWDEGPYFQTHDVAPYREALKRLAEAGRIYRCRCTRSQILAASLSAPHAGDHELRYPGNCRPETPRRLEAPSDPRDLEFGLRFRVDVGEKTFRDQVAGDVTCDVAGTVGDFLVATKGGMPSYQLAVVVDDARQQVDRVVRGDDLLTSTPRQLMLYEALQFGPVPEYYHLPLVVGPDGRRLAKRHGDSRLEAYREAGVSPERIVGLVGEWCGLGERREMSAEEFRFHFRLQQLSSRQIVFTPEDDQWLRREGG